MFSGAQLNRLMEGWSAFRTVVYLELPQTHRYGAGHRIHTDMNQLADMPGMDQLGDMPDEDVEKESRTSLVDPDALTATAALLLLLLGACTDMPEAARLLRACLPEAAGL